MLGKLLNRALQTGKAYGSLGGATAAKAAVGGYGRTVQGAVLGGVAGAGWGAVSGDTSVLGGAMMGAGLGAGAMRYGGAAIGSNIGIRGGIRRAGMRAMGDIGRIGGTTIRSNGAYNNIMSSLKNWGSSSSAVTQVGRGIAGGRGRVL